MTKFAKENFEKSGMYVNYVLNGERKFVARFKYSKDGKASFISFLIKNFTVEEYFGQFESGIPPMTILENKGYVSPAIKKLLIQQGYEPTVEGKAKYIANQVRKYL